MDAPHELATENPWINTLKLYVQPDWNELVAGEWATRLANGSWSTDAIRGWCLQLYPFVHAFPKFLAEALIKVEDEYSRSFLIDNIRVEKAHAEHWLWMGEGFGLSRAEMMAVAEGDRPMLRDVQSLSDWIWFINAKGSLAEAIAATSFAIEGATGDLTRGLISAFEAYGSREGVTMNPRTTKWFRNHAKYDDDHPRIALEVVARYAQTDRARMKVMVAARRSLQLMNLALLTASREYSHEGQRRPALANAAEPRMIDRRHARQPIAFPDRRIVRRHPQAAEEAPLAVAS
ncbi:MAG TPA: iron-containing redox enzyme family protein [Steroidobacteraceae bacterium]|nr:iron-containing redox enzyme family protein [Steroidobacteraceae bacterium]